jgi:hypothetical protein
MLTLFASGVEGAIKDDQATPVDDGLRG